MKTVHLAPLAAVLLLAACTPMQWARDDTSAEQLSADAVQCQQEAWREARFRSWAAARPIAPIVLRDAAGRPFVAWMHSPFYDPFGDPFMEESRLAQFCMRAKGYRLEPVEKAERKPAAPPAEN
jgi:hypothetical protein